MSKKEAYALALKLWIWLFKNPGKEKKDSPYWDEIKNLDSECSLCEFYIEDSSKNCMECCLSYNICFKGAYGYWVTFHEKHSAGYIASKIRRACRKEGFIDD